MKPAKILFFIDGPVPKKADYEKAAKLEDSNSKIVFRNAQHVPSEKHALEAADGVAGLAIPDAYAAAYPTAEEAIKKRKAEFKKLTDAIEDEKPPAKGEVTDEEKAAAEEAKAKALFESKQTGDGTTKPAWNANKQ